MSMEQMIIAYLVLAVIWNANKWITANKTIRHLINERDKYKNAWTNGNDVIVWNRDEKARNN